MSFYDKLWNFDLNHKKFGFKSMNNSIVERTQCLQLNSRLAKTILGKGNEYDMLFDQ